MKSLLVINVVGLTPGLIGKDTPHLLALERAGFRADLEPVLPAVTCSAQSTLLTGRLPREHGIVGNGWYFKDLAQVWLWRQSNYLVNGARVWERGRERDPSFTCAKIFWWYNMYSTADWSITPRPAYYADGRKAADIYADPPALGRVLTRKLGRFPLFQFWGPGAGLRSSTWIAAAARHVIETCSPTLSLVYLPHLDYDLQRYGPAGPGIPEQVRAIDDVVGGLIETAQRRDVEVIALSEYGMTSVTGSISVNRELRRAGFLQIQEALNGELLDAGASLAFAVSDHQIAHVYVKHAEDIAAVRQLLASLDGVEQVLDREALADVGLDHERSGDLVAVSARDRWFDYYYWLDDAKAPDFARTVDIHQKPGYDPLELFLDPGRKLIKARVALKVLRKKLGFRYLMDVIPLDTSLVRGSHGRLPDDPMDGPVLISSSRVGNSNRVRMTDVADLILETIFSS